MPSSEKVRKGSPYAKELISHFEPYCIRQAVERGEKLDLHVNNELMCYLILEGTVALYRSSDNVLLSNVHSPAVLGIANISGVFFDAHLRTVTPCLIGTLAASKVEEIVIQKALWDLMSKHFIYVFDRLYHTIMPKGSPTAYEMIRQQLTLLMSEDDDFRLNITAERYIRDKTQLSRSGVMRILADLKTGGFIEMDEGRLLKINKLPAKY